MSRRQTESTLNYASIRALQISFVFALTIFIQYFFNYPNAGWTGFAVMMIYAGFDNGTTLSRAYHRFLGVLMGLITGYILAIIGHIEYRLLFFMVALMVFLAYFLTGKAYSVPTIFTVNTSVIGTAYFSSNETINVLYYLLDYCVCTCVAFGLVWFIETRWFSKFYLQERFLYDVEERIIENFQALMAVIKRDKPLKSEFYVACIQTIQNLNHMHQLLNNAVFYKYGELIANNEVTTFIKTAELCYTRIKALYFAYYEKKCEQQDYQLLLKEIEHDIKQLILSTNILKHKVKRADKKYAIDLLY